MSKKRLLLIFNLTITFLFVIVTNLLAQSSENIGFENGDFKNWKGYRGLCCGSTTFVAGIENGWHTIMDEVDFDANSNDEIPFIAPDGGFFSVRLGNPNAGGQAEKLVTSFLVDNSNSNFTYMYAVILQDPSGHDKTDKPMFEIKITDNYGNLIKGKCGSYQVVAGSETDNWSKNGDIRYKNWTKVGVDLRDYIGQVITVEFKTQDCGHGGHFGYAYVDAFCKSMAIETTGLCNSPDSVLLTAPEGFISYYWPYEKKTSRSVYVKNLNYGDSVVVYVENEAGCQSRLVTVIKAMPLPEVITNSDLKVCIGTSVKLSASGAGSSGYYIWNSSTFTETKTGSTIMVVPKLLTNTYTVTAYNANGCTGPKSTKQIKVTVDFHLMFGFKDKLLCKSDSVFLCSPKHATSYTWKGQSFTLHDSCIRVYIDNCETISLSISDSICSYTSSITINIDHNSKAVPYCFEDSTVTISGPNGASSYLWLPDSQTTKDLKINKPIDKSIYTLIMTNAPGCFDTLYYKLSRSAPAPDPKILTLPQTICKGGEIFISADNSNGSSSFFWTTKPAVSIEEKSGFTVNLQQNTTFYLKVSNYLGCTNNKQDSVLIKVNDTAYFELGNDREICYGDKVVLDPHIIANRYSWTSSDPGFSSFSQTITVSPIKTTTYYLTDEKGGCIFSDQIKIILKKRPNPLIKDYCANDSFVVLSVLPGFTDPLWLRSGNKTLQDTVFKIINNDRYPLKIKTKYYCYDTMEYILNEIPNPIVYVPQDTTICVGDSFLLNAFSQGKGFNFEWTSIPAGFSSFLRNPLVWPEWNTIYTIKVTNELGCFSAQSVKSVKVTIDSSVFTRLGNDTTICEGDQVELKPIFSSSATYLWTSNPPANYSFAKTQFVRPSSSTFYFLKLQSKRCIGPPDSLFIYVRKAPVLTLTPDTSVCEGDEVEFHCQAGKKMKYFWQSLDSSFSSKNTNFRLRLIKNLSLKIKVTDTLNCSTTDTVNVYVYQYPVVNLEPVYYFCKGKRVALDGGLPATDYLWMNGIKSRYLTTDLPGIYIVTTANGPCISYGYTQLINIEESDSVNIPNVFTPNNDGVNDNFTIDLNHCDYISLIIYNRWGQPIKELNQSSDFWNGKNQFGVEMAEGVYYYTLTYKKTCNELPGSISGTINLFR